MDDNLANQNDDELCPTCGEEREPQVVAFDPTTANNDTHTVGDNIVQYVCVNVNCPEVRADLAPVTQPDGD